MGVVCCSFWCCNFWYIFRLFNRNFYYDPCFSPVVCPRSRWLIIVSSRSCFSTQQQYNSSSAQTTVSVKAVGGGCVCARTRVCVCSHTAKYASHLISYHNKKSRDTLSSRPRAFFVVLFSRMVLYMVGAALELGCCAIYVDSSR